jgi:hypothetical protein
MGSQEEKQGSERRHQKLPRRTRHRVVGDV